MKNEKEFIVVLRYNKNENIHKMYIGNYLDCMEFVRKEYFVGVYMTVYKQLN